MGKSHLSNAVRVCSLPLSVRGRSETGALCSADCILEIFENGYLQSGRASSLELSDRRGVSCGSPMIVAPAAASLVVTPRPSVTSNASRMPGAVAAAEVAI